MQRILEFSHLTGIGHAFIRSLLQERLHQIGPIDTWCGQPVGVIAIAEPGESIKDLEEALGWPLFTSLAYEWIEDLSECYEIAAITGDSGSFILLIIPIATGMDPVLMAFCEANAHSPALPCPGGQVPGPSSTVHKLVSAVARSQSPIMPTHQPMGEHP